MKTSKKLIFLIVLTLFVVSSVWAQDWWVGRRPKPGQIGISKKVTLTGYWSTDPVAQNVSNDPPNVKLMYPDGVTEIKTVPIAHALKYQLEGSGWIVVNSKRWVINLEHYDDDINKCTYDLYDYLNFGLDGFAYGLVPWRTIAADYNKIPLGSMVYIEKFDYNKNGNKTVKVVSDTADPFNESKWVDVKHDGWFVATDISWSFQGWHIDFFAGVESCWYSMQSHLGLPDRPGTIDIVVYPYNQCPVFLPDTTNSSINTIYYRDAEGLPNNEGIIEKLFYLYGPVDSTNVNRSAFGDYDGHHDGANDDWDELSLRFLKAGIFDIVCYKMWFDLTEHMNPDDSPNQTWYPGAGRPLNDITYGDVDNDGEDEFFILFDDEKCLQMKSNYPGVSHYKVHDQRGDMVTSGDYDADGFDDIAILDGGNIKVIWSNGDGTFVTGAYSVPSCNNVTCFTSGDMDGRNNISSNVRDEIIVSNNGGIKYFKFTNRTSGTWYTYDSSKRAKSIKAIYLDSDDKADILFIPSSGTDKKVYERFSSFKSNATFRMMHNSPTVWVDALTIKNELGTIRHSHNYPNVFKNGNFNDYMSYWDFYCNRRADASHDIRNGAFYANIRNGGYKRWHVQLRQNQVPLDQGHWYCLKFDARSIGSPRIINALLEENGGQYKNYSGHKRYELSTEMQTYSLTFKMEYPSDPSASICFELGKQNKNVIIDNVVLMDIAAGSIVYPNWELYKWYYVGDKIMYNGVAYKCTHYHYSQPGLEPDRPQMWAVWKRID